MAARALRRRSEELKGEGENVSRCVAGVSSIKEKSEGQSRCALAYSSRNARP